MYLDVVLSKLKEVLYPVLPITLIVIILNFTLVPLELSMLIKFIIGAVLIIIGLAIFLLGVEIGVTPIGNVTGSAMAKSNKLRVVIVVGLILGFFISIAEPDLHILAGEVDFVTAGLVSKMSIVVIVSIGIAAMLTLGLTRIIYNISLNKVLIGLYAVIFVLALFTSKEFLAISFDASGATTGAFTVPFILALAAGISGIKKDSKASEKDSFGLIGITSTGAILAVMVMSILSKSDSIAADIEYNTSTAITPYFQQIIVTAFEVFMALLPILIFFLIFQKAALKLSKKAVRKVLVGLLFTFIGLVMFLVGVNTGFMDVGSTIGYSVASLPNKAYLVIIGFVLGFVTILAEPAVYVLTHQIEDVTSGYVRRKIVMITLSIGVGVAVALSMVRILVPEINLWHYLLPGYVISLAMTFFVPELFVGIAFDSGGVASGPMTATFILAYAHGAADAVESANVMVDGFGMIAMVALTPIIALQVLGFIFKVKSKEGGIEKDHELL